MCLAAGLHQRLGWVGGGWGVLGGVGGRGLAPRPWQSRGGAVCRMVSAKAGRKKAAQTKGLILPSKGGREAAVSPVLVGPGFKGRGMRLKARSRAGQKMARDLLGFDLECPF